MDCYASYRAVTGVHSLHFVHYAFLCRRTFVLIVRRGTSHKEIPLLTLLPFILLLGLMV